MVAVLFKQETKFTKFAYRKQNHLIRLNEYYYYYYYYYYYCYYHYCYYYYYYYYYYYLINNMLNVEIKNDLQKKVYQNSFLNVHTFNTNKKLQISFIRDSFNYGTNAEYRCTCYRGEFISN